MAALIMEEALAVGDEVLEVPDLRAVDGGIVDPVQDAGGDGEPDRAARRVRRADRVLRALRPSRYDAGGAEGALRGAKDRHVLCARLPVDGPCVRTGRAPGAQGPGRGIAGRKRIDEHLGDLVLGPGWSLARRGRRRGSSGHHRPSLSTCRYVSRSEEHTSELQSLAYLVCRLLLEKKKKIE